MPKPGIILCHSREGNIPQDTLHEINTLRTVLHSAGYLIFELRPSEEMPPKAERTGNWIHVNILLSALSESDCHIVVAICDWPSTELGLHIATTLWQAQKPVLGLMHTEATPCFEMSQDVTTLGPLWRLRRYNTFSEIPELINVFVKETGFFWRSR